MDGLIARSCVNVLWTGLMGRLGLQQVSWGYSRSAGTQILWQCIVDGATSQAIGGTAQAYQMSTQHFWQTVTNNKKHNVRHKVN